MIASNIPPDDAPIRGAGRRRLPARLILVEAPQHVKQFPDHGVVALLSLVDGPAAGRLDHLPHRRRPPAGPQGVHAAEVAGLRGGVRRRGRPGGRALAPRRGRGTSRPAPRARAAVSLHQPPGRLGAAPVAHAERQRSLPAQDALAVRHDAPHVAPGILPCALRASLRLCQIAPGDLVGIDSQTCAACGGAVRIIACIEDPEAIEKILAPLDTKTTESHGWPPPCRAPPQRGLFDSHD
jgi:hypothetical protein